MKEASEMNVNDLANMLCADDLKEALKKSIDLFDFNVKTEEENE